MTDPLHIPQHKQEGAKRPTTLREAISFDQLRREAAYQEYLANKERYQSAEGHVKEQQK